MIPAAVALRESLGTLTLWFVARIADSLDPLRLAALSFAAAAGTVVSLIAGHRLWERSPSPESRPAGTGAWRRIGPS